MPKRINAIPTEATDFAEDDFMPIDGLTGGTRKFRPSRIRSAMQMRALGDALFFGRGQSGSHAVWSSPEHGIIGTNDFTIAIPVLDWWYATSGQAAGLTLATSDATGSYSNATVHNNLTLAFDTSGILTMRMRDAAPNHDANTRGYLWPKATLFDVVSSRPGMLIYGRRNGSMFLRVNTTGFALPVESVTGSPVSTWAGYIDSTYHRLGQIFTGAGYLGKLGVPLIYTVGLSDSECDRLVSQGPRSLPYRHGSFKNYAPQVASGWSSYGDGVFSITDYDLATDPDGVGTPVGYQPGDACIKVTRSGGTNAGGVAALNLLRLGGPAWRGSANVRVTALAGASSITWDDSAGSTVSALAENGQINAGENTSISVGAWTPCSMSGVYVGSTSANTGVGLYVGAASSLTAYIHKPSAFPLGLLFDGTVQPVPQVWDNGPNKIHGQLINRVDPICESYIGQRVPFSASFAHSAISTSAGSTLFFNLPAGWALVEVQANVDVALNAGTTLAVGTSTNAGRWVAALPVDTTGLKYAPSLQLFPQSLTGAVAVSITKNQVTTVGNLIVVTAIIERKY